MEKGRVVEEGRGGKVVKVVEIEEEEDLRGCVDEDLRVRVRGAIRRVGVGGRIEGRYEMG